MENSLTIQNVIGNKDRYNLAIPFLETRQANPFYKASVSLLTVDTSEQAGEVFKVGSKCVRQGNKELWVDLFSLTKPFLQRLATEAGIQFAPGSGDVFKMDENTWKASAFGALKLPDGTVRTSNNFKVIDLQMEEKKYRILYEEKAEHGISDFKTAKAASEKYRGHWEDTGEKNEKGYLIKKFFIDESDRCRYIEKSLLDAMTQLRANAPQKAATGAILRVIRDLTGVKGNYTMDELKKPFAVARMSFSPDYNDPLIKQMMLQQCMQSVGNLFGAAPVTQTISIPKCMDTEDDVDLPVDVAADEPPIEQCTEEGGQIHTAPAQEPVERAQDFCCDKCGIIIPEKVWDYSVKHFERPLCFKCQKLIRNEQRGGGR